MILSTNTSRLEVVLAGAITTNQLVCFTSYEDFVTGDVYKKGRHITNTNNTTTVDLCPVPDTVAQRDVKEISIYNRDTVNATVTIKLDENGTEYEIFKVSLATGERIEYVSGEGFKVLTSAGAIKTSMNQGAVPSTSGLQNVVLASDVTNNNAVANTIADVTGLSFPVLAGKTYWFQFNIQFTAAATTTGSRWSIQGPTTTRLNYRSEYSLTTTTSTRNAENTAYDLPAASNATSATTGSNMATIEGLITPSADGTVIARFASEVASSAIVAKAGSNVYYQQLN